MPGRHVPVTTPHWSLTGKLSLCGCGGTDAARNHTGKATMLSILTRAKLALAVLAVAAVPVGAAFAEGNGSLPGGGTPTGVVTSAPAMPDVGQVYRPNPAYTGTVTFGGMLPPASGSQGEPESANSLPPGALNGTLAMQRRQALQRYWAEQAGYAQHLASANQQPNG